MTHGQVKDNKFYKNNIEIKIIKNKTLTYLIQHNKRSDQNLMLKFVKWTGYPSKAEVTFAIFPLSICIHHFDKF